MSALDEFNGLDGLKKSMGSYLTIPKRVKPKHLTYWQYCDRSKILKQINREAILKEMDEDLLDSMEIEAIEMGSSNKTGFIIQYE
jgi:hypothetical protein